eukprot:5002190-Prorocentrum_lima.AAC.1
MQRERERERNSAGVVLAVAPHVTVDILASPRGALGSVLFLTPPPPPPACVAMRPAAFCRK